jgi:hypothetical protein
LEIARLQYIVGRSRECSSSDFLLPPNTPLDVFVVFKVRLNAHSHQRGTTTMNEPYYKLAFSILAVVVLSAAESLHAQQTSSATKQKMSGLAVTGAFSTLTHLLQ